MTPGPWTVTRTDAGGMVVPRPLFAIQERTYAELCVGETEVLPPVPTVTPLMVALPLMVQETAVPGEQLHVSVDDCGGTTFVCDALILQSGVMTMGLVSLVLAENVDMA